MSRRLVAGLVALVAVGGVFAYGLSKQDDVSKIDTKHVDGAAVGLPDVRGAPRSRARRSTASGFTLAALRGKPVFINFWGSWCPGCKDRGARSAHVRERARLAGLDGRRRHRLAATGHRRRSCARPAGAIPIVRKACCDLVNRYGVIYFPTTVVVDGKGQVVDRLIGPQTVARLRAELRALGA